MLKVYPGGTVDLKKPKSNSHQFLVSAHSYPCFSRSEECFELSLEAQIVRPPARADVHVCAFLGSGIGSILQCATSTIYFNSSFLSLLVLSTRHHNTMPPHQRSKQTEPKSISRLSPRLSVSPKNETTGLKRKAVAE